MVHIDASSRSEEAHLTGTLWDDKGQGRMMCPKFRRLDPVERNSHQTLLNIDRLAVDFKVLQVCKAVIKVDCLEESEFEKSRNPHHDFVMRCRF